MSERAGHRARHWWDLPHGRGKPSKTWTHYPKISNTATKTQSPRRTVHPRATARTDQAAGAST
ncbi:hypothetical protein XAC3562_160032 [Xanthomonas citri pv. citri]|uniref:Uncharacterized protein n=1 Tax=Xanthomonas citri pv. citri TaxID=611301 RepID=A0A0U5F9X2_XANCI|nr:hypothetical protein XAC3562_160032 [Xanthomonas citri pv. citri]CEH89236.1 hypothetical protein XAC3612_520033 [Xanthomonas citri pv. citri]CEJ22339.1 hypothetical protein XACE116_2540033 [Xanthomonas citri pv. citri]CEJ26929.1 hypothetical protein XACE116_2540033 [Xanthomonas citri pv. citri]